MKKLRYVNIKIETGSSPILTRKEDSGVIFSVKITEDGYGAVTGIFYVGDKKIHITGLTVEINDELRKSINSVICIMPFLSEPAILR